MKDFSNICMTQLNQLARENSEYDSVGTTKLFILLPSSGGITETRQIISYFSFFFVVC